MMDYKLSELKLLVQGGEADLYEIDEHRLLRVLRRPNSQEEQVNELYAMLEKHQVKIPKIYEYGMIDGKQAEVMERLHGGDMLSQLTGQPLRLKANAQAFSKLHQQLLMIDDVCELPDLGGRFELGCSQIDCLEPETLDFVRNLFHELPDGNAICHSDFHPGNILMQDGVPLLSI